ncbi:POU domain, class 5, transcription factor 1.2-like [Discoglossus pictus]
MGVQGTGESPTGVMAWNTFSPHDYASHMGIHRSGHLVRDIGTSPADNISYMKRDRDFEALSELPEAKISKPTNFQMGHYYNSAWNTGFWPNFHPLGTKVSPNLMPSQQLSMAVPASEARQDYQEIPEEQQDFLETPDQSPTYTTESGISSMENTRCSSTTSTVSSVQVNEPIPGPSNAIHNEGCNVPPISPVNMLSLPPMASPCVSAEDGQISQEMEQFVRELKQKRISMGFTQLDVGHALGVLYGKPFSQTTICRFESLQLSDKNMNKLKPILVKWMHEMEHKTDLQEVLNRATMIPQAQKRKQRTSIDAQARLVLENFFARCSKPSAQEMTQLANDLQMEKDVVRVWFCNRRQKGKRPMPPNVTENMEKGYSLTPSPYSFSQLIPPEVYAAAAMSSIPNVYSSSFQNQHLTSHRPAIDHRLRFLEGLLGCPSNQAGVPLIELIHKNLDGPYHWEVSILVAPGRFLRIYK